VLDVRTSNEYNQNHLKGAFLADWTNRPQFVERVSALDKAKPVYTYCLSGARSAAAAKWLRENGYIVYNMSGGIAAWKQAGKPLEEAAEMPQMSLQQYQALIPNDKTTLVDVSAVWCPPCKKMKPIVDSLATSGKFKLVTIDGGEQTSISNQLGIEAFPTFIVYKNGKEVWRKSGMISAGELSKQLH
jgi:rhodanese-related sulfurtransferase